jgi:hypothetical protein
VRGGCVFPSILFRDRTWHAQPCELGTDTALYIPIAEYADALKRLNHIRTLLGSCFPTPLRHTLPNSPVRLATTTTTTTHIEAYEEWTFTDDTTFHIRTRGTPQLVSHLHNHASGALCVLRQSSATAFRSERDDNV